MRSKNESATGVGECAGLVCPCRRCTICKEWWPLEQEYFYRNAAGGRRGTWQAWCKACFAERRRARDARRRSKRAEGGAA